MTQDIHKQLQDNYELLQNKLLFLQREKIIKVDAATRFQLEQEIKEVQTQIQEVEQEIKKQQAKLSTNFKENSNPSGVTAASASSPKFPIKLTQQQKILILTAIPHGLCLDKEIRENTILISPRANSVKILSPSYGL
ncbi:hypothetical protein LC605_14635 [Nostoc sp. CHAB 5836]|uniref:hypothetical protein n=1 Tax=Nostoc sp. CHAB 5836 TaxID=2780404 RepID=UPI001E4A7A5D|nr:hypothetical protein [Nostoc sp. CHAB 5836]MCC5616280.1 hypothetical protein [Nostoc sp. CHAB 5836]